ncbi:uncharacterized protein I206_101631 [Kwoniella pini CBS 10737]|uniref:Protein kinase domain-containing protein n=1 Tax=Kwoniella pini CBS 10737 TaxID=1296096 RepID=A0A1B9HW78_9TREE|nr:uncharacterized protein I206_06399 [Kwoniella pini CBS 10737]OCF47498.1 hypothetical protein I206_06399 [Kwoniella pini CBS 10737]
MSFIIDCSTSLDNDGRYDIDTDLIFFQHPRSGYNAGVSTALRGSTSNNVPPELLIAAQLSPPVQIRGLTRQLSRVKPSSTIADGSISESAANVVNVIRRLAAGSLWDYWLIRHPIYGTAVLKLIEEAVKEDGFYVGPLLGLQGDVVPRYYGLYQTIGEYRYYAMLLEYIPHPLGSGFLLLSQEWNGVLHRDIDIRHILVDDHDRVCLVGFRHSKLLSLKEENDVDRIMGELGAIRMGIGLEDEEDITTDTIPRSYFELLPDPEGYIQEMKDIESQPEPDWLDNQVMRADPWGVPDLSSVPEETTITAENYRYWEQQRATS